MIKFGDQSKKVAPVAAPAVPTAIMPARHRTGWKSDVAHNIQFDDPPAVIVTEVEVDNWKPAIKTLGGLRDKRERRSKAWGDDELKVLHLIALYGQKSTTQKQPSRLDNKKANQEYDSTPVWVRGTTLLVMMYEMIVQQAVSFDYAPQALTISVANEPRALWVNISQDVFSTVNHLRAEGMIELLKSPTPNSLSSWAVSLTDDGRELLQYADTKMLSVVTTIAHGGLKPIPANLVKVTWSDKEDGSFRLTRAGKSKLSAFSSPEDISYVTSPFLPEALRNHSRGYLPTTKLSHRVAEAARGLQNTKAKLSEKLVFSSVSVALCEWLPFDTTQMSQLNDRTGAQDRCRGFVDLIAANDNRIRIRTLDFDYEKYINFEAESQLEEQSGIVQVEQFGVHIRADGTALYGLQIEAMMLRLADYVSAGMLARMVVDVQEDSSIIMHDMMSPTQQDQIETVMGPRNYTKRRKLVAIFAESIKPRLRAAMYTDGRGLENEIAQMLGSVEVATEISADLLLFIGNGGILLVGTEGKTPEVEQQVLPYIALRARDVATRQVFWRCMEISKLMEEQRLALRDLNETPDRLDTIRETCTRQLLYLRDMDRSCSQLVVGMGTVLMPPVPGRGSPLEKLHNLLNCTNLHEGLAVRLQSLNRLLTRTRSQVVEMQRMMLLMNRPSFIRTGNFTIMRGHNLAVKSYKVCGSIDNSLFVFKCTSTAIAGWMLVDRLGGGRILAGVNHTPDWISWLADLTKAPGAVLFLSMFWIAFWLMFVFAMSNVKAHSSLPLRRRVKTNCCINAKAFKAYLRPKKILSMTSGARSSGEGTMRTARWQETSRRFWKNCPPTVEVTYSADRGVMFSVLFEFNATASNTHESMLWLLLRKQMFFADVFPYEQVLKWPDLRNNLKIRNEYRKPDTFGFKR